MCIRDSREPVPVLNASTGGYYTLRGPETWGMVRCAEYRDRPAHADQLHLDLWWRGANIALDSGTYLYNPEPEWYDAFVGTVSYTHLDVYKRQVTIFRPNCICGCHGRH